MINSPTNNCSVPAVSSSSERAPVVQKNDNSNPQQGSGGQAIMSSNVEQTSMVAAAGSDRPSEAGGAAAALKGGRNTMKSPPTKKDSRKLFVGGLPADVVESEFREFFEQFGEVVDSVVMFDRETHRSRGFGFVTFQDPEVAEKLLGMDVEPDADGKPTATSKPNKSQGTRRVGRLVMRGKTCEVKAAEPKESGKGNRRVFQGQAGARGSNTINAAAARFHDPRFYAAEEGQAGGPQAGGFSYPPHPHHAIPGPYHMPQVPGGYYHHAHLPVGGHPYMGHPGMYAPPQGDAAHHHHHPQHPHPHPASFPPIIATHMDARAYMEGSMEGMEHPSHEMYYQSQPQQEHTPTNVPPPEPQHQNYPMYPANNNSNLGNNSFATHSGGPSVMQPAAPGLPQKEESP